MDTLPQRTVKYNGLITEAYRWSLFRHRADDIFVCAPAKCGTTWMQAICSMLVMGSTELLAGPGQSSPWLDANFLPPASVNRRLDRQTHRRLIKTHTPLDGIPFYPECTYLTIYRDPRDVFFSYVSHLANLNHGFAEVAPPTDLVAGFMDWCRAPLQPGRAEQFALAFTVHHFLTFWAYRHLPKVHLFHYADLKRDPVTSIDQIAAALGIKVDAPTISCIAEATNFPSMRARPERYVPAAGLGLWKSEAAFFAQARHGQWRSILDEPQLAAYRTAMAGLVAAEAASWLENGAEVQAA